MRPELSAKFHIFRLKVSDIYDEYEIEELLETFLRRGVDYQYLDQGWYQITVPEEFDWRAFYRTARECSSISRVETGTPKVIYLCEPEG